MSTGTDSVYEGPRISQPQEYDEIMGILEKACGTTRRYFINYWPHMLAKENFIFEDHFIIRQDERAVSHIGLFPMEVVADGYEVKIGGIGDMDTHPDYQGRGYMGKLLNYSVEEMKKRGIALSVLWGDTQRYRHFGWENTGREMLFHLNKRSVKKTEAGNEFTFRGYRNEKDMNRIIEIHDKEPLRAKRSPNVYGEMLKNTRTQIWMGKEKDSWVYAVLEGREVIEFGGQASIVAKLFSSMLSNIRLDFLNVHYPCIDNDMLRTLYKISARWNITPLGMIKIIDLKKTLLAFKEQIQKKVQFHQIEKGSCLGLNMKDTGQKVNLILGDEVQIESEEDGNTICLSDIEAVRLLFGPASENFGRNEKEKRLLTQLFPLDFYIWGLDHV